MEKLLTIKAIMEILDVSESTIRRMIFDKRIPCHKIGGQWRFIKEEIDQWVKKNGDSKELQ